jgi:phage shock protein PspC (stress-responsive transcriptional regulator)
VRGPSGLDVFFDRLRRLGVARASHGKIAGGVCAGLARRWGLDPAVVRAAVVILMLVGGLGLLAYLVALALLPDESGKIFTEEALRRGDGSSIFLLVVIAIMLAGELSDRWWVWAAVPLALLAWWVVRGAGSGRSVRQLGSEAKSRVAGAGETMRTWTTPTGAAVPADHCTPTRGAMPPPPAAAVPTALSLPAGTPSPWAGLPQDRPVDAPIPASTSAQSAPVQSAPTLAAPVQTAPHGMGPGRTWSPASAPPPHMVVRERRRAGGFPVLVTTLGLAAATYGVLGSLTGLDERVAHPRVFAVVGGLAVASLVLVVVALRGLRAPFTAFLVTSALVVSAAVCLTPAQISVLAGAGEREWQVSATGATGAAEDYALGFGSATLDLTKVPAQAKAYPVKVSLGFGELVVIVPDGVSARVDLSLGVGEVSSERPGSTNASTSIASGSGVNRSYLIGTGEPNVVITASVGVGSVILRSSAAPTTALAAGSPAIPPAVTSTAGGTR